MDVPFSARVFDAGYLARMGASLPFSSHSLIAASFQTASEIVTGVGEKALIAAQEEVMTMRFNESLVYLQSAMTRLLNERCVPAVFQSAL